MNPFQMFHPIVFPSEAFSMPLTGHNRTEHRTSAVDCPLVTLQIACIAKVFDLAIRYVALVGSFMLVRVFP